MSSSDGTPAIREERRKRGRLAKYERRIGPGPGRYGSLMYAARHAEETPDKPAIVMATGGEVVTYAEYEARANQMAHLLREAGLQRRDHVAIFMNNDYRMLVSEGGAERTGLYFTCVNSYLSAEEAAYVINDSESQVVMTTSAKADIASQLPALCPDVKRWLMLDADANRIGEPFEDWDAALDAYPTTRIPDEQLGVPMLYSSGTTGRPKGIMRPLPEAAPRDSIPLMEGLKMLWRFREGMVYLNPAPLYHSAPQASVSLALRLGATVVVMEHFEPAAFLDLVERHRVTHSQMVPTMFSRLLKLPEEVKQAADTSSLEVVIHAAAPCPAPVKRQMIEWWGPILIEYYAATEANGFTFVDSEDWLQHEGTVGKAIVGELLILDEEGATLPDGRAGNRLVQGRDELRVLQRPGEDGRIEKHSRRHLHRRRRRLRRRGGISLPDGPEELHDHLRRCEHLPAGDGELAGHPPEGLRRRRHRRTGR